MIDGQFHLTFLHTVLDSKITTYFAFVYPFSYTDLQKKLDLFEARWDTRFAYLKCLACTCSINKRFCLSFLERNVFSDIHAFVSKII